MMRIVITDSFRRFLKKLKKHFKENEIIQNIEAFIRLGYRKGETKLATEVFGEVVVDIVKLRIRVRHSDGRLLVGIINNSIFMPIFIDLKTGYYGRNLSFEANRRTVEMIEKAFEKTLTDYLEHTEEQPRLTEYSVKW